MSSRTDTHPSLERSLNWTLGVLLLLVLLLLLGIAAWIGRESAIQFALSRLHHDAEAILSSMDLQQHKLVRSLPPIYTQPLSGHYYMVQFDDGERLFSRSLWNQELVTPEKPVATTRYWLAPGPQDQHLLIWQSNYEKEGQAFSIAIAEDIAPLLSAIQRFIWIGVLASVAAVLLMLLLQRLAIRRSFARLDTVRQDVRAVRQGQQTQLGNDVPVEVQPVVAEFNQLLLAWEKHQERSRNAVGNLAHALKAPLNLIFRHGQKSAEPVLMQQAQQMQRLIERELKRARITGRAVVGKHFCPETDLADLVDTIQTLHHQKPLQIETIIHTPQCLALDQNDMLEIIGNLLDNAAKWTLQTIRLQISANGELLLMVEDDGPGVTGDQQQALLERGKRLDENQPGHGLGLAIVNDIANLYGGSMTLDESPDLKGLRVSVRFPLP